jgi:uncharacterized membrane protein YphA (DoxX/SURF4 family)
VLDTAVPVFALVMGCFFVLAGAQKLFLMPAVTSNLARLGVGSRLARLIGAVEIAGAIGLACGMWCVPAAVTAAVALAALMMGATVFHAQAADYRRIGRHRDAVAPPLLMAALLTLCALLLI